MLENVPLDGFSYWQKKKAGKIPALFFRRNVDELVKNHEIGDTIKRFRCKARKYEGMRRTYWYAAMTEDAAQRSPSTLLRAVSLSNGRWTFYEVVNVILHQM